MKCTIINNKVDPFDINTSSKEVSCNEQSRAITLKKIVIFNSFFLLQVGVNADWVKELLLKKFSQLLCTIYPVNEDNGLVEG